MQFSNPPRGTFIETYGCTDGRRTSKHATQGTPVMLSIMVPRCSLLLLCLAVAVGKHPSCGSEDLDDTPQTCNVDAVQLHPILHDLGSDEGSVWGMLQLRRPYNGNFVSVPPAIVLVLVMRSMGLARAESTEVPLRGLQGWAAPSHPQGQGLGNT